MKNLDPIESRIRDIIMEIPEQSTSRGWSRSNKIRSHVIREKFHSLAKEFDINSDTGWLYDLYWYEITDGESGYLIRIPLVVEWEWSPDPELDGDFQKLVQARAEHRVWIFQISTPDLILPYFERCKEQIQTFRGTIPGDRYLFAGIDNALKEFHFEHFVA